MSGTKLYAGEATLNGIYVHVMAYKNSAHSYGANAMILPIPAKTPLSSENVIDTRSFKGFLDDIAESTKTQTLSRGLSKGVPAFDNLAEVFDVGSYTVVLAERPEQVPEALQRVPANKRPVINTIVLASYNQNYPGWPLAVCCWDGAIEAEPLLWWYEPKDPEILFAPALDAHDGNTPKPHAVAVDHIVCFGSTLTQVNSKDIRYHDLIPEPARKLLPTRAFGQQLTTKMPNGDFGFFVRNFKDQDPKGIRFWPGSTEKTGFRLNRWT